MTEKKPDNMAGSLPMIDRVGNELSQRFKLMALASSLLVVAIHCCSDFHVTNPLIRCGFYDGICRIAVPFFFMTSGFFLVGDMNKTNWWRRAMVKRIFSLGVPYLLWITLFVALINGIVVFRNVINGAGPFCGIGISLRLLLGFYGLNPLCHPALFPLWYIRALLILVFISPIIVYAARLAVEKFGKGWVVCAIAFAFYLWLGRWEGISGNTTYFFRRFFALQGLFYFSLGIAWRLGCIQLSVGHKQATVLLLVGALLMVVKTVLHITGSSHYHFWGCCAVPFLLVSIFNLLPRWHLPSCLASCAFPVYVFHMFVITIIRQVVHNVSGVRCLLMVAAVYGITVACVLLQRKYFGWLNRCLWGGR